MMLDIAAATIPGVALAKEVLETAGRVLGTNPKDLLGIQKPGIQNVPPSAILALAEGFVDGAKKYGPFNWRENKVQADIYYAAAIRHLMQWFDGENVDPISKVRHLAHAMSCLAILVDAEATGNLVDNRPLPGAAANLIRDYVHPSQR